MKMVNVNTSLSIDERYVEYLPSGDYGGFYQVGDGLRLVPPGIYYWSLPGEFLGDRVMKERFLLSLVRLYFGILLNCSCFVYLIGFVYCIFSVLSSQVMEESCDMIFTIHWVGNYLEYWTSQM